MWVGEVELLHRNPSVAAVNRVLDSVHNDAKLSLAGGHNWKSQLVNFNEETLGLARTRVD